MPDRPPPTNLLYSTDAYRRQFDSTVVAVDPKRRAIALEATAFFPTGGGQPHDAGTLAVGDDGVAVTSVTKDRDGVVWHTLQGTIPLPRIGQPIIGHLDWERRHLIMRLHTAQHIMNGIVWREHQARVTGAQISPPEARLDFELPEITRQFGNELESKINAIVDANLPVRVLWLPREKADRDPSLLRLKANLIPPTIDPLRVVDIVGLDRQADGGTHVASTREVGHVHVLKTESKGSANKRIRFALGPVA